MSVLQLERHPVQPASVDAFETRLRAILEDMRRAPGALWADAARAFDDDPSYVIASEWRTEADAEAWTNSAQARRFASFADPLVRGDVSRRRFTAG